MLDFQDGDSGLDFGPTTELHSPIYRANPALRGSTEDQVALELGQAAQDREHQPSVRRRSVSPGITQGLEACPSLTDCRKSVE